MLRDGFGIMNKCKREAVRLYNKDNELTTSTEQNYYRIRYRLTVAIQLMKSIIGISCA